MKLPDKREVGSSTLPRPINLRSLPRKRLGAGGVFLFCVGLVRGVHSWCPFGDIQSSGIEFSALCERRPKSDIVRLLVAFENSLCRLPTAQEGKIAERDLLQFRRELPTESVPPSTAFEWQTREFFQTLPLEPHTMSRHWLCGVIRRGKDPTVAQIAALPPGSTKSLGCLLRERCASIELELVSLGPPMHA
jgi:hypothetical protein